MKSPLAVLMVTVAGCAGGPDASADLAGHSDLGRSFDGPAFDAGAGDLLRRPRPNIDGSLPIGWTRLANATTLKGNGFDHCPANNFDGSGYHYDDNCGAVYGAWTSGAYDPNSPDGPRFLIFGGGHSDYVGTEIYSINIRNQTMTRLTNPSPPPATCSSVLSDGRPNISAHTYGMVSVVPELNKLYVWARLTGTLGGSACGAFDMWALDLGSIQESCAPCAAAWTQLTPTNLPTTQTIVSASSFYNPGDHKMYVFEPFGAGTACRWSAFDPASATWSTLNELGTNCALYMSLGVDEGLQVAVALGSAGSADPSGNFWMDIATGSTYAIHHPAVDASCQPLASVSSPALTWDSARRELVGYPGTGGTIYIVHVDRAANAITCTSESYGSTVGVDVPEDNNVNGGAAIFNKFHFKPIDNNFILSDNPDKTAWVLTRN